MPRLKSKKHSARLLIALNEAEYEELTRLGAELNLSATWLIRRTISDFMARHREGIAPDLSLRPPELNAAGHKKMGGTSRK